MHVEPEVKNQTAEYGKLGHLEKGGLVEWIDVPVLNMSKARWVEGGTVGVVVLAFVGLCWVLFGKSGGKGVEEEKKKKKQ
jgi:hypothetical protein